MGSPTKRNHTTSHSEPHIMAVDTTTTTSQALVSSDLQKQLTDSDNKTQNTSFASSVKKRADELRNMVIKSMTSLMECMFPMPEDDYNSTRFATYDHFLPTYGHFL